MRRPLAQLPELLRVKGRVLLSMPQPDPAAAEALFLQSLDESRRQQARSWELRTATDLAALHAAQARRDEARALLQPVFGAFAEGLETADLEAAGRLLADLG